MIGIIVMYNVRMVPCDLNIFHFHCVLFSSRLLNLLLFSALLISTLISTFLQLLFLLSLLYLISTTLLSFLRRIGVQEGSTRKILDHPFFASIDNTNLKNGSLVPEFVPEPQTYHEPISTLKPVKAFSGDQKQFKDF